MHRPLATDALCLCRLHALQFDPFELNLKQAGLVASYSGLMNVCSRALGGIVSDLAAKRFGMRGRLWTLWFLQTASGGVCVAFGFCSESLNNSITTMIIFSFLTQMSCGATYGIVPFSARPAPLVLVLAHACGGTRPDALPPRVPAPRSLQARAGRRVRLRRRGRQHRRRHPAIHLLHAQRCVDQRGGA
jgi:hypothetical protein